MTGLDQYMPYLLKLLKTQIELLYAVCIQSTGTLWHLILASRSNIFSHGFINNSRESQLNGIEP